MEITKLREQLNMSQREFADKFCINMHTLQSWEQGWRRTPERYLVLIRRIVELEAQVAELQAAVAK